MQKIEERPEVIDVCWLKGAPHSLKSLYYLPVSKDILPVKNTKGKFLLISETIARGLSHAT